MYRVLIVEDEAFIRAGIINLINWKELGCKVVGDCTNGSEALNYIKNNPVDILVTDIKMPEMDGLELISEVNDLSTGIQSIILTAYSEFSYAKKAIEYGVIRFVIKNDFVNELPSAVEIACNKLQESKDLNKSDSGKNILNDSETKEIKSYILESLAHSKMIHDKEFLEKYQLNEKSYCILSCEIFYGTNIEPIKTIKTIEKILQLAIDKYEYYLVDIKKENFMIIMSDNKISSLDIKKVEAICRKMISMIKELMNIDIKLGISSVISQATDMSLAYKESLQALSELTDPGSRMMTYKINTTENHIDIDVEQLINNIIENLFSGDNENALSELANLKRQTVHSKREFKKSKIDLSRLLGIIFKRLKYFDVDFDLKQKEAEAFDAIDRGKSIYSVFRVCKNIIIECEDIIQTQKVVKSYLINSINQYIKSNYKNDISLDDISNEMHVSKSYICRIYKNKVGITLTEAINRHRVEKAKSLLLKSSEKISEIAYMVGFDSAAYFTNIFKKYVEMSPSDYRNSHIK